LTEEQKEKAVIALRKIECQKDVKAFKLAEYYRCVRLSTLLRLPFSVIKKHVSTRAYVAENGLLSLEMSQEIPINKYLLRDSKLTFETWLERFYPSEYERMTADRFGYLFGRGATSLTYTDHVQELIDQFDKFTWFKSEEERRYFFSSLLQDADIDSMNEFDLFGCADGSHSQAEIDSFKSELLEMQKQYLECPENFFHPDMADLNADAVTSGSDSILAGCAPPGTVSQGEGASCSDMMVAEME
jgi:hypothetical protein